MDPKTHTLHHEPLLDGISPQGVQYWSNVVVIDLIWIE